MIPQVNDGSNNKLHFHWAFIAALAMSLNACGVTPDTPAAEPADGQALSVSLSLVPVGGYLEYPVAITHGGDGSGRLFVVQQDGRIRILDDGVLADEAFLDIRPLVSCCGEQGLLSVAFDPDFRVNGHLYVDYINRDGDTVVARYTVSDNPGRVDPASERALLTIPQPTNIHNGGQLQFGPDGYLYIATGDGGHFGGSDGSGGDPENMGQRLDTLLGKILRIDVHDANPYSVPDSNPFLADSQVREEIWAYGLRNPWRFSFDRLTGDMFIADVGQSGWEEINYQPASSKGSANYGWRKMEGSSCFNPSYACNDGSLTLPIIEYQHHLGCAVTGGYRYRGRRNPELYGMYLFGDYCTGRIWGANSEDDGQWQFQLLLDTDLSISTFGEDEQGEIYVADRQDEKGRVFMLVTSND